MLVSSHICNLDDNTRKIRLEKYSVEKNICLISLKSLPLDGNQIFFMRALITFSKLGNFIRVQYIYNNTGLKKRKQVYT